MDFWDLVIKHRDGMNMENLVACYGHQFHPEELLASMDIDNVNMLVGGSEEWQTTGMEYLTPTSCVYSRQMIGFFHELSLNRGTNHPGIKTIIQTNFCSGDYHSAEILREYLGIETIQFTIPYKITNSAFKLVLDSLKFLIARLTKITGKTYDPARLEEILGESNVLKEQIAAYSNLPLAGKVKLDDFHEVTLAPWHVKESVLSHIIKERSREIEAGAHPSPAVNVIVTGSPVLAGDSFSRILEGSELQPRFFDFHFADQASLKTIPTGPSDIPLLASVVDFKDPLHVLAAYFLEVLAPERMVSGIPGSTHLDRRIQQLAGYQAMLPRGQRVDGIINHVLKFCDVYGTDRAMFKEQVQARNSTPVLDIERDFSTSSVGQIATRLEAFKELLEQRKTITR